MRHPFDRRLEENLSKRVKKIILVRGKFGLLAVFAITITLDRLCEAYLSRWGKLSSIERKTDWRSAQVKVSAKQQLCAPAEGSLTVIGTVRKLRRISLLPSKRHSTLL